MNDFIKYDGDIIIEHEDPTYGGDEGLRRNALKEQEQSKPPRAFREIYRFLKSLEATEVSPP